MIECVTSEQSIVRAEAMIHAALREISSMGCDRLNRYCATPSPNSRPFGSGKSALIYGCIAALAFRRDAAFGTDVTPVSPSLSIKDSKALERWIRRHMRKMFWLRWHDATERENALRRLRMGGRRLKAALTSRGAWHMSRTGSLQSALSNQNLRRYGFFVPSDLAAQQAAEFNRRMRKTARPVVWEGDRALNPGHST